MIGDPGTRTVEEAAVLLPLSDTEARALLPQKFLALNLYSLFRGQGMSPETALRAVLKLYRPG